LATLFDVDVADVVVVAVVVRPSAAAMSVHVGSVTGIDVVEDEDLCMRAV